MKRFFVILLILGLAVLGVCLILASLSYSDGDRAGTISKFSQKGYLFKTYEGELLQGGFSEGTGQLNAKEFVFSVAPGQDSVVAKLKEALLNGNRVRIHYEEKYFRFFWMGDSKYFITDVDFATETAPQRSPLAPQ
jgi:hypothetical protein